MTQKVESAEHQKLVRAMVKHMESERFSKLKAALGGYENPDLVNGFIPDVSGVKNDQSVIVEAETCDSYAAHEDQVLAFAKSGVTFWLIVPKVCLEEAKDFYKNQQNIRFWSL